jgi:hypothetical protein
VIITARGGTIVFAKLGGPCRSCNPISKQIAEIYVFMIKPIKNKPLFLNTK